MVIKETRCCVENKICIATAWIRIATAWIRIATDKKTRLGESNVIPQAELL